MNPKTGKNPELPLIQLRLAAPFIQELKRLGMNASEVLSEFALEGKNLGDEDHYVTAATMYRLAERLSEYSGDPHFGVHVGAQMDLRNWPPTVEAARRSSTVGEFLLRFMERAGEQENTVTFVLNTVGKKTTFQLKRFTDTGIAPRHNDGFTIAYVLNLLRDAVGDAWDGSKVVAQVCDPDVIPPKYLGIRTAVTDTMGARLVFPSHWLVQKLSTTSPSLRRSRPLAMDFPAANIVDAFRFAVLPHIHDPNLDVDRAAAICGIKKRTLARKLQSSGTSISHEIQDLRRSRAERELLGTRKAISAIALDVGYNDPVVFTRAFKRWTGMTPSQFRRSGGSRF